MEILLHNHPQNNPELLVFQKQHCNICFPFHAKQWQQHKHWNRFQSSNHTQDIFAVIMNGKDALIVTTASSVKALHHPPTPTPPQPPYSFGGTNHFLHRWHGVSAYMHTVTTNNLYIFHSVICHHQLTWPRSLLLPSRRYLLPSFYHFWSNCMQNAHFILPTA